MNFASRELSERMVLVLQFVLATMVTGAVLFVIGFTGGPDIEGNAPTPSEVMPVVIVGLVAISGFFAGGVLLQRGKPAGRVLSLVLDGALAIVAAAAMLGDLNEVLIVPASVFRSDVAIHGVFFLVSAAACTCLLKTAGSRTSITT